MKYNLEFSGKDCNDEKYTMLGTVEISESKCFQYGNGKIIKFNVTEKEKGYSNTNSYDIRYDTRYKNDKEIEYIRKFIKDNFSQVVETSIVIYKINENMDMSTFIKVGNRREAYKDYCEFESDFDDNCRTELSYEEFCKELNKGYGNSDCIQIARLYELVFEYYMKIRKELFGMTMNIYKNIGKIGENKMKYDDFTSGEYVKKEDVMTYLRVFDWTMPREELIEKFKGISSITLNDQDINKVKINKVLNGEWNND